MKQNTLKSSLKGFTWQHCAGNGGCKQFQKLNRLPLMNASVSDIHMNAAEFPFRLMNYGRITVGSCIPEGF